jgi:hypothetical protein
MKTDVEVAGLEQVREKLTAWRGQRNKGERIPDAVWGRAVTAVHRYGLNRVSRALRLDYYSLKRRTEGAASVSLADRSKGRRGPAFVELGAEQKEAGLGCVVELEKGNGTRLRICVREAATVDWGKLKEAFLGA